MKTQWFFLSLVMGFLLFSTGCKKKETVSLPVLTTSAIGDVTRTTAKGGGTVTGDGGAEITSRGVCWGLFKNPDIAGPHTIDGAGTGSFASNLTGLIAGTTWFVRAYATNSAGTSYGDEIQFATLPDPVLPVVTTRPVTDITLTTATCGGEVLTDGGAIVTHRGICWSTSNIPTILDQKTIDGEGTGIYPSFITGLESNMPYFVRAYATNTVGTAYGDTVSFTRLIPDSIEFTQFNPEIVITSVRAWSPPTLQYACYQPIPNDSSASYNLDTDQDGTSDFRIYISNWYEFHSASNPCYNFQYFSNIRSIAPGDSIAVIKPGPDCALELNYGDEISSSLLYSERAETVRSYWMSFPCNLDSYLGEGYYGFKMQKGSGFMYGWLLMNYNAASHKMTIKEFAFNRTLNKKILAGQKQ